MIDYPHYMDVTVSDSTVKPMTLFSTLDATRKTVKHDPFDQVLWSFKFVDPNTTIDAWDMIYIGRKTSTPNSISVDPNTRVKK